MASRRTPAIEWRPIVLRKKISAGTIDYRRAVAQLANNPPSEINLGAGGVKAAVIALLECGVPAGDALVAICGSRAPISLRLPIARIILQSEFAGSITEQQMSAALRVAMFSPKNYDLIAALLFSRESNLLAEFANILAADNGSDCLLKSWKKTRLAQLAALSADFFPVN